MRKCALAAFGLLAAGCHGHGLIGGDHGAVDRPAVVADAEDLRLFAASKRFAAGRPSSIRVTNDGSRVLFLRSQADSFVQDLYAFDTATGRERVLLSADDVLQGKDEALSVEERARRERMRVTSRGIVSFRLSEDSSKVLVPISGRLFVVRLADGAIEELVSEKGFPIDPKFSPDGRFVSCVRGNELYVIRLSDGLETRLTKGAGNGIAHAVAEFVAQEEMGRHEGYWWSPDSTSLVYQRTDTSGMETMHIADAMHPERAPQSWPYPRPGKRNAAVSLGIIAVEGGATTWIKRDEDRYPYLATVRWSENGPLTILVQNRRQTEEALLRVDADTGSTSVLLTEHDDAWLNLDQAMPKWLPDCSSFLWTSERNGAWQLELRSAQGALISALTSTDFNWAGFVSMDAGDGVINHIYLKGNDPATETHVYRLSPDAEGYALRRLTSRSGTHDFKLSKENNVYVHAAVLADGSNMQTVKRVDGSVLGSLRSCAISPPFVPDVELTTVGQNPRLHAALIRPRNFDAHRKYPVIVYVYGGPHAQVVRANPGAYFRQQWLADHGFVVVAIDGRGTPSRGRVWERAIKGDLIGIPLTDQVHGLKALGRRYPEMDLARVGIYGWSFGGYFSAMAVLLEPGVYHVGIAGAPVTDWMDYDTHYTERYLDLPENNETGYRKASALTYADQLRRPLMLIHGSADDNVYFKHSLNLSRALFDAGKKHDMLVLSGFTHLVQDPEVTVQLYTRMADYFLQHLYQVP